MPISNSFVHVHIMALRYFAETARAGSMRQAADFLSVAPSAVNRQILKLESQLRAKLFDRVADGVRLTSAGEVLYGYIRNMERDLDRAINQIDSMRELRRGHVRIAVEDGIARDFLIPELSAFSAEFPGVIYSIAIHSAATVMELVAAAEVEIGLSMNPPMRADIRKIGGIPIRLGVVMPADHPLATADNLQLGDLAGERMILGDAGYGGGEHVNRVMTEGRRLKPFIETNSSDTALELTLAKLGLSVRTPVGAMSHLESGALRFVPLAGPRAPGVELCLWTHSNRSPSTASAILTQRLIKGLADFEERLQPWEKGVA
ncbi:LysR family transcriptional regulator [Rhizobium sp. 16-449-1b]|uniref:LysR family transcriptional regulator n=1 Tax=Rhizobium sp. 16-449-1b TaxID=2819989 RepID=UPI001ADC5DD9|nr:LysR family transcriptional regulator [Rhizobium sp. 16-449-1b]MBO9196963.1 LysR family transcriptional regulator [Rhizobium sp. 16-449-1b]